jgi:bacterioferritin-associated ferredoxin
MYVCVCRAVTDEEVETAIADGAHTVEAVTKACCAGEDCGACHSTIAEMIDRRCGPRRLNVIPNRAA